VLLILGRPRAGAGGAGASGIPVWDDIDDILLLAGVARYSTVGRTSGPSLRESEWLAVYPRRLSKYWKSILYNTKATLLPIAIIAIIYIYFFLGGGKCGEERGTVGGRHRPHSNFFFWR
jgi:hypothetical protein